MARHLLRVIINGPVYFTSPARLNSFDGILAYSAVRRFSAKKGGCTEDDIKAIIDDLPLRKMSFGNGDNVGYFYAASMPEFREEMPYRIAAWPSIGEWGNSLLSFQTTYYKANSYTKLKDLLDGINIVTTPKSKKVKDIPGLIGPGPWHLMEASRGPFKKMSFTVQPSLVQAIEYVFDGDPEAVFQLVNDLDHIGKKTSCGFGKIKNVQIKKTDSPINRMLPVQWYEGLEPPMFPMRLTPPYWETEGMYIVGKGRI
jgi:hypothetical protein